MLEDRIIFDERDPRSKAAEKVVSQDALKHIHDDIGNIRRAGGTVSNEMWGTVIVCEPPPITPRCHSEEREPNPYVVDVGMLHMGKSQKSLQQDLQALQSTLPSDNAKALKDFTTLANQMVDLNEEISTLNILTNHPSSPWQRYPKGAILEETDLVDKIARNMDKTRKLLQKDLEK